jgi:DnaK suppressor protein
MAQQISPEQITKLKQQLLELQTRLQADRSGIREEDKGDTEEGQTGDIADYDPNDPADEASNLFDRDRDQANIDNESRLLSKIARALEKIEDGTYGLSDIDGTPIPLARLQALPYALTTVEQDEMGY